MDTDKSLWSIVLAAGEGSRLRELTTDADGHSTPKQFCSLKGGPSLLQEALDRASAVARLERTVAIVARQHHRWWSSALQALPSQNIVVQPSNKGTAIGILLPLLHIVDRDPDATVLLLPSDHFVENQAVLTQAIRDAERYAAENPDKIVLLGLEPDDADPELGYILPEAPDRRVGPVARFLEKPSVTVAREVMRSGGLWNILIVVGSAGALLALFMKRCPDVVMEIKGVLLSGGYATNPFIALQELYDRLPTLDFSRHLLEGQESELVAMRVPHCGWNDLGTPRRVFETLRRLRTESSAHPMISRPSLAQINLATQLARYASISRTAE
jgi:mannose-1-phosphate guanylyltransferase